MLDLGSSDFVFTTRDNISNKISMALSAQFLAVTTTTASAAV